MLTYQIDSIMRDDALIQQAMADSFQNFHAKGFDYLCLTRSDDLTIKAYILDGDCTKLSEVVNPHDHRYNFSTMIVSGQMSNTVWSKTDQGASGEKPEIFQAFDYLTPLNGGNGFTWREEQALYQQSRIRYNPTEAYRSDTNDIHTISMHADQTILILVQYRDEVPVGVPTTTYISEKKAPSLDGLYDRFTEDRFLSRLSLIREKINSRTTIRYNPAEARS